MKKQFWLWGAVLGWWVPLGGLAQTNAIYAPPTGGWTYLYRGDQAIGGAAGSGFTSLDGTWGHDNDNDEWDGLGRGTGVGAVGGLSTDGDVLTIEDASTSGSGTGNNRKLQVRRPINYDAGYTTTTRILDDGVTLSFRARLTPANASPAPELSPMPNGFIIYNDGNGNFGVRQNGNSGGSGGIISFSLVRATEDLNTTSNLTFSAAGLTMNRLNGDSATNTVNSQNLGGSANLVPLDPTAWHEFWITIRRNDSTAGNGTHTVTIYVDGVPQPQSFNVTAGTGGNDYPSNFQDLNYLAMGCPASAAVGAFDTDFFAYKIGLFTPLLTNAVLPAFLSPTNGFQLTAGSNLTLSADTPGITNILLRADFSRGAAWLGGDTTSPYSFTWNNVPAGRHDLNLRVLDSQNQSLAAAPISVIAIPPGMQLVYQEGFDGVVGPEWSTNATDVSPLGARRFLGQFSDQAVTLTQTNLPLHGAVTLTFDLFILRSWDGNSTNNGPDLFDVSVAGGPTLLHTTFNNDEGSNQSYPDNYPAGNNPRRSGAAEINTLGFTAGKPEDTVYRLNFTFTHTNRDLILMFSTANLSGIKDETWGLDNVALFLNTNVADLALQATALPAGIIAGDPVTFTFTVTNQGPGVASGIFLTNLLPAEFNLVSATVSQGVCLTNNHTVIGQLGALAAGSVATLTVIAQPLTAGDQTNVAMVVANDADPNPANNVAAALISVTPLPALSLTDIVVSEGDLGTNGAVFTVQLSPASSRTVSVAYATMNGTATAGADYLAVSGTLIFSPGITNQTFPVPILGDALDEADETFTVWLTNATNAVIARDMALGTILDDDPLPSLSVADVTVNEGHTGTWNVMFAVRLSAASGRTVTVNFDSANETATAGVDYAPTAGALTFPPGTLTQYVAVTINGDFNFETDETFLLNLGSPVNAILANAFARGTILNDDAPPLDHFTWNNLASTQWLNQPFGVTITARDAFEQVVTNFTGVVNLSGSVAGQVYDVNNTIVGNLAPTGSNLVGNYTMGYAFTPATNLLATHFHHFAGCKVSLWTDSGTMLASQYVQSVPGTWTETELPEPLTLSAGQRYRLAYHTCGTNYYWRTNFPVSFPHGTMDQSYYDLGDVFPNRTSASRPLYLVDLRYNVGGSVAVALTPTLSGGFTNGFWSGTLAVQTAVTNLVLRADDGSGHIGVSNPFSVLDPAPWRIRFTLLSTNNQTHLRLTFAPDEACVLESSLNLRTWTAIFTNPAGGSGLDYWVPLSTAKHGLYRVRWGL